MSDTTTDLESPFERDMCLEGSHDFEDNIDRGLSQDLLRMWGQSDQAFLWRSELSKKALSCSSENKLVKLQPYLPKQQWTRLKIADLAFLKADRRHQSYRLDVAMEKIKATTVNLISLALRLGLAEVERIKAVGSESYPFGITVEQIEATKANLASLAV
ncbi:hypothetical protein Gotur_031147 [Gossypium turneri]